MPVNIYIAALLGALMLLSGCGSEPPPASRSNDLGLAVTASEVTERDLTRRITLAAAVESRRHFRLSSPLSGLVNRINVVEGDQVNAGDALLHLDTREVDVELRRARADQQQIQLDYDRHRALLARGSISDAQYQAAKARLDSAISEVERWQTRLELSTLRAPQAATVTARHIEPGEAVDSQRVLIELAVLTPLMVRPALAERDVHSLTPGQTVRLRVDALPEHTLDGTLQRIFPSAQPDSRLIPIEISLPDEANTLGIRPGYLVRLELNIDPLPSSLTVPDTAVAEDDEGHYVYRIVEQRLQRQSITPGQTRGGWRQVLDGLDNGDTVLATHPAGIADGNPVRIIGWH